MWLGHSPFNLFTCARKRILPASLGSLSVMGCTSNWSLASGKKSAALAAVGEFHSIMRGRRPLVAAFSHQARAEISVPLRGRFFCHVSIRAASFEDLVSGPTFRVASTLLLPGTHW